MNGKNTRKIKMNKRNKINKMNKRTSKKGGTYESYLANSTRTTNPSRLVAQRASKVLQSALQQSVKKSKIKALTQKHASKKIQQRIRRSFDFEADDCAVCLEKKFVRSKVSPLSCHSKHGLHTKCLNDLLKSERFRTENNRKCPMCKAPAAELQNVPEVEVAGPSEQELLIERLNNRVSEIINTFIEQDRIPRELNNADNISNLNFVCRNYIYQNTDSIRSHHDIVEFIRSCINKIQRFWEILNSNLNTCNRTILTGAGTTKTRIGDPTLIPLRDSFFSSVLAYKRLLSDLGMELPDRMLEQMGEITRVLNRKPNIGQPAESLIRTIYNRANGRLRDRM